MTRMFQNEEALIMVLDSNQINWFYLKNYSKIYVDYFR